MLVECTVVYFLKQSLKPKPSSNIIHKLEYDMSLCFRVSRFSWSLSGPIIYHSCRLVSPPLPPPPAGRAANPSELSLLSCLWVMAGCREYWMIYRLQGFLAVVWFGSSPHHLPPSPASMLDQLHTGELRKRDNLLTKSQITKLNDSEKAWSSLDHSILSSWPPVSWSTSRQSLELCEARLEIVSYKYFRLLREKIL